METKKSINFIENPEELTINDMLRIKGGKHDNGSGPTCRDSGTLYSCSGSGSLNTGDQMEMC